MPTRKDNDPNEKSISVDKKAAPARSTGKRNSGTKPRTKRKRTKPVFVRLLAIFSKRRVQFVLEVLFAFAAATLLISTGPYRETERQISDLKSKLSSSPAEEQQVVIVSITNEDYENLFTSRSPLDPYQLARIVNGIVRLKPRVIGVDIDTSNDAFSAVEIDNGDVPIVWAQDAVKDTNHQIVQDEQGELIGFQEVLGGKKLAGANHAAPVTLIVDTDDKVRFYQRVISSKSGDRPSWSRLVYELSHQPVNDVSNDTDHLRYINFSGPVKDGIQAYRFNLQASQLLELAETAEAAELVANKIVILGGHYEENKTAGTRDLHKTPVGEIYGADLLASIIETENAGGGMRQTGLIATVLVNIFAATVMMMIFHLASFWRALLWSGIAIVVISIFVFIAYGNLLIMPALIFLLFFQITDKVKDHFKHLIARYYSRYTA